ncbi:LysR family transcriptional regulator [Pseudomonas sp. R3.Fl]|uniref:LysR family transcriptional regulator n=1 Tax=Pseudomonas sp. R3.Fl TaxID=2928708 RepID=UPI00201D4F43|nr:LysR family transcriptional regulator [Pseudomonas sp. R3.Fl]MCL6691237.1 LysR family transcriptional regulator [Pseudomonas sp. R3.Fl]
MLHNVSDLDLRLLRIFATVVRCGGFSAAQGELGMGQSTISTHIASLETRLGYRLCERGKSGFRLTDKGALVLQHAQALFAALGDFRDQVQSLAGRLVGELRLGLADNIATLPEARIHEALARFGRRDQEVRLQLSIGSSSELERQVLGGELHLAIACFSRQLPNLRYRPLYSERVAVFCGRGHPLFGHEAPGQAELEACAWVQYGYAQADVQLPADPRRSTAQASNMEAVVHAVRAGTHLGYLPTHYAQRWVDLDEMRPLLAERLGYGIEHSLLLRDDAGHNQALQALVEDLCAVHGVSLP